MKSILRYTVLSALPLFGSTYLQAQVGPIQPPAQAEVAVGIGTDTPTAFFNVAEGKEVLFGLDLTRTGNKLIWYGAKGAFRAGSIQGSQWSINVVGQNSFASGTNTTASGYNSTAMGTSTDATGFGATALGNLSQATGLNTTAMGYSTKASGQTSMALGNQAESPGVSAMSIGTQTKASGNFATALGYNVEASGIGSMALGHNVSTNGASGSVIIGDGSPNRYVSDGPQKMTMRFGGGYVFYSAGGPQNLGQATIPPGVELRPGQSSWFVISDSTKKENYRAVDGTAILRKISQMRLGSWNYRGQDPKTFRHYGPMAQDFFAAFGNDELGLIGEPTGINQADFDGVNMIAIKALINEVNQLKADNQQLRQQLNDTQQLRSALDQARQQEKTTQSRLARIEALLSTGSNTLSLKP